ncbi:MAG: antibiotic biosynthesis monooxygenase [Acidobacteria bacterium]|nr:antibiotic biosynthesis monooxygenase [Acidobacteriota bacterium]
MLVLLVHVQVKPQHVAAFLDEARHNAGHAVADEPGCLRFDVIQDRDDPHRFTFYEVYRDDAALAAHRQTPHFTRYIESTQPWLAAPAERRLGTTVVPTDAGWR